MPTLYDLSAEYKALIDMDAGDDAGFIEALDETLAAQGAMLDDKIEATIIVSRALENDAEECKAEAKRLTERARRFQDRADQCKERVRLAMEDCGKSSIKRAKFTITRVPGRPIAQLDDEKLLPADYVRVKEMRSADRKAILDALQAGERVPGASLTTSKDSLRIS